MFFVSTGIRDENYPWNKLPQNISATSGERFGFSNRFAMSMIFGEALHGFKGAPQKKIESQKPEKPLNHYRVEKEMSFVRIVYVFVFSLWRK